MDRAFEAMKVEYHTAFDRILNQDTWYRYNNEDRLHQDIELDGRAFSLLYVARDRHFWRIQELRGGEQITVMEGFGADFEEVAWLIFTGVRILLSDARAVPFAHRSAPLAKLGGGWEYPNSYEA